MEGIFLFKTSTYITASQLTSLIISISLKVRRSSQSTFTMWPCRCAFVSWTEQKKKVTKGETQFTGVCKTKKFESDAAAELITAWWLMCKLLNQSCTNPVLSAKPVSCLCTAVSVAVGSVNTHLARKSWPTNHMVRISTQSLCQHTNWERPRTSLMLIQVQKNVKKHSE